jgi:opacity protein-like surface antigen
LFSSSLVWQCFATELEDDFTDSEEKKFYIGGSVNVLGVPYYKDKSIRDHIIGSIIGGYNYTENVQAELEVMFGTPKEDSYIVNLLANLRYIYKIENMDLTPYLGMGMGVGINKIDECVTKDSWCFFLAHQIKVGVEYPITSEISISGGYRLIGGQKFSKDLLKSRSVGSISHGLEVEVKYNF